MKGEHHGNLGRSFGGDLRNRSASATLAGISIYVWRLLARTWFNPAWMAARREKLLNDPLHEGNWETWA